MDKSDLEERAQQIVEEKWQQLMDKFQLQWAISCPGSIQAKQLLGGDKES